MKPEYHFIIKADGGSYFPYTSTLFQAKKHARLYSWEHTGNVVSVIMPGVGRSFVVYQCMNGKIYHAEYPEVFPK